MCFRTPKEIWFIDLELYEKPCLLENALGPSRTEILDSLMKGWDPTFLTVFVRDAFEPYPHAANGPHRRSYSWTAGCLYAWSSVLCSCCVEILRAWSPVQFGWCCLQWQAARVSAAAFRCTVWAVFRNQESKRKALYIYIYIHTFILYTYVSVYLYICICI